MTEKRSGKGRQTPPRNAQKEAQEPKTESAAGSLIGRGALVNKLAAAGATLAEFTEKVQAKYPASSAPWCKKHLHKALERLKSDQKEEKQGKTGKEEKNAPKAKQGAKKGKSAKQGKK